MIEHIGNMWSVWNEADHFIFTGNSTVKKNGALVMGRGIAREVRDKFPGVDVKIGHQVEVKTLNGFYGVILGSKLGIFQVKNFWGSEADLELVYMSSQMLEEIATANPDKSFHMNYPAIGNGKRDMDEVAPLLENLPDNVHIWRFR